MKLTIGERLDIQNVLPRQADILTAKIKLSIAKKTDITKKELETHKFRPNPQNPKRIMWDKASKEYEIKLDDPEMQLIKGRLIELNDTKKLDTTESMVSLYGKIVK